MTEPINWDRRVGFANTGERVWLSHFETPDHKTDDHGPHAVVSDKEGAGYTYDRVTGAPRDRRAEAAGWICNVMTQQEMAAARVAIKRAQAMRAAQRAQTEGIEVAGDTWGMF